MKVGTRHLVSYLCSGSRQYSLHYIRVDLLGSFHFFKKLTWWNSKAWLIEPQLAFRTGLKKFKAKISDRHSRILTAENIGLIKNIIMLVPIKPTRLVCHEKNLNEGLEIIIILNIYIQQKPRPSKFFPAFLYANAVEITALHFAGWLVERRLESLNFHPTAIQRCAGKLNKTLYF
jgi:hypothetical protein